MSRSITAMAALGTLLFGISTADAATFCASYKGGPEKAVSRSHCTFSSLDACRQSVRSRGGGHCYKKEAMR